MVVFQKIIWVGSRKRYVKLKGYGARLALDQAKIDRDFAEAMEKMEVQKASLREEVERMKGEGQGGFGSFLEDETESELRDLEALMSRRALALRVTFKFRGTENQSQSANFGC